MTDSIDSLATEYHDFRQRTSPTTAHLHGDYRFADLFEDVSRDAEDEQIAGYRSFADRAAALPDEGLDEQGRITRDVIVWDGTARADLLEARLAELDVDPIAGPQAMLPIYMPKLTMPTSDVADAMIEKYRGIARMLRDLGQRHLQGIANGRPPTRMGVDGTIEAIDRWLANSPADDPLANLPPSPAIADPDRWRNRLRGVVQEDVRPALAEYRDVLREVVAGEARPDDRAGLSWLPNGADTYARAIRFYTTLARSPQEIHQMGREQVDRLAEEYREIGGPVLGTRDVPTILERLRSDPALHHTSGPEIVAASETALAKAKAAMGDWFGILPRADCHVEEVDSGPIAYYFPPTRDGTRGGIFFMNTSNPEGWGRFEIESTSYHEGIPGHHLQLAIAAELEDIPEFRKRSFISAYGEGWGLYSERLADEMGLYSTDIDRLGMLAADSLRACRLVVDTGLHAFGWSRQQAIDYMVENSPQRRQHVTAEVDRYIVTPGQALAYMLGRIEITRMRRSAEERLRERFEIKGFHDAVLSNGPLPLPVLDRVVSDWVARASPEAAPARDATRAQPTASAPRRTP